MASIVAKVAIIQSDNTWKEDTVYFANPPVELSDENDLSNIAEKAEFLIQRRNGYFSDKCPSHVLAVKCYSIEWRG